MSGINNLFSDFKNKYMSWFQNDSRDNSDLAKQLHDVLSQSNATLNGVNQSFEKLWTEINHSKLEMVKFSTEVNSELNSINKSIDDFKKAVSEMERSMFGNNGTKGLYVRMNQVEANQQNTQELVDKIRVSVESIQSSFNGFSLSTIEEINKKLDSTDKIVLRLESKIKDKEDQESKKQNFTNALIITGFSGAVMTFGGWIWTIIKSLIGN